MTKLSLGRLARSVLGKQFYLVGEPYRAIFLDVPRIARTLASLIPPAARCLDVGGGDGAIADSLLRIRPDIHITIADLLANVGGFVDPVFSDRIALRAGASLKDLAHGEPTYEIVMVNDVVHHVPVAERAAFLSDLADLCLQSGCGRVLIKDVEPRGWRAKLGLWSDLYITGDRNVVQIGATQMQAALADAFRGKATLSMTSMMVDFPNYCIDVRLGA